MHLMDILVPNTMVQQTMEPVEPEILDEETNDD
jgi:hypothetical protein